MRPPEGKQIMPIKILMPALSPTMTEGNLAKWLKQEGDEIRAGDVIAEIETDKATMEVEAVDEGVLGKILVQEGAEGIEVNAVIALMLQEDENPSALEEAVKALEAVPAKAAAPAPEPEAAARPTAAKPAPKLAVVPTVPAPGPKPKRPDGRIFASPLARRLAKKAGLDLKLIGGTGPHGRIVKADVEAALSTGAARAAPGGGIMAGAGAAFAPAAHTVVPLTTMRKVIASRMSESMRAAPHFFVTIDCDIGELLGLREELNELAEAYKLTLNDFVIRAAALALLETPEANAAWSEEGVLQFDAADISVAVATEGGLITPIIRSAEKKGLAVISGEMKELSARAHENKLTPEEYQGGTFTVSNLGMFGVREFTAIINPPQACILAVGAGEERPVAVDGELLIAPVMSCTLSCDHRVADGVIGARFMAGFKTLIEHPVRLLL